MRRWFSPLLAMPIFMAGIVPVPAADFFHAQCSDFLEARATRDAAALRDYAALTDLYMGVLNGTSERNGKAEVDLSDPRWGKSELRQQQAADFCRDHPQIRFEIALQYVYDGYRVSSGLGSLAQPGVRR